MVLIIWTFLIIGLINSLSTEAQSVFPLKLTRFRLPVEIPRYIESFGSQPADELASSEARIAQTLRIASTESTSIAHTNASVAQIQMGRGQYWNPSVLRLPSFFHNPYLVVARTITEGMHQKTVYCEATRLEDNGFRCETSVQYLDIPPSAAKICSHKHLKGFSDFPGFHDPRLLWGNDGELILIGGTQSAFGCFGLSAITLSERLCPRIVRSLERHSPYHLGPTASFATLIELNRPGNRDQLEKNWVPIISPRFGFYVQHDLDPSRRVISKHLGAGVVTLAVPEQNSNCFPEIKDENGMWHQATNSLELKLCKRKDERCGNSVFISLLHRKITNRFGLMDGGRYERYIAVWDTTYPFKVLAIGSKPIVFSERESDRATTPRKEKSSFAYSVSMTWDTSRPQDAGYLEDEIIIAIGKGDMGTFGAKISVFEMIKHINVCSEKV